MQKCTLVLFITFAISLLSLNLAFSQNLLTGRVVEKETKIPIAFATVVYSSTTTKKGTVTDVNGLFEISLAEADFIEVSCVGYEKIRIDKDKFHENQIITIELPRSIVMLREVVVSAKYNPAIPIVQRVLENKAKNDHDKYESYSFQNYIKTIFDRKLSAEASAEDSARFFKKKDGGEFRDMAVLVMEYVLRENKSGAKVNKTMDAYKISGIENPDLAQIFASLILNSVSFYKNDISFIEISGATDKTQLTFISPFADNCLKLYDFQLENTLIGTSDTLFQISFAPQKGKLFSGLKGNAFISSYGYAIKTMVVEPTQPGLMNFRIVQEHEQIRERWFPSKLKAEVSVKYKKLYDKTKALLIINISSNIDSVSFGKYDLEYAQKQGTVPAPIPETVPVANTRPKTRISMDAFTVSPEAVTRSSEILEKMRPTPLTSKEQETYRVIDSVFKEIKFEKFLLGAMYLGFGSLPISIFDLEVFDMVRFNQFEGARLGLALSTNDKVSRWFSLGGYFGYGIKDEEEKFGGRITFNLHKERDFKLKLAYNNTYKETGRDNMDDINLVFPGQLTRNFFGYQYDRIQEIKGEISARPVSSLVLSASVSVGIWEPKYEYFYIDSTERKFRTDELALSFRYAPGEQTNTMFGKRFVRTPGNPVIEVKYKQGLNLFSDTGLVYSKIEAAFSVSLYKGRIGHSLLRMTAGMVDRDLPYNQLFTGFGSYDPSFRFIVHNHFQTMKPYEFLSDRYVNLFYSHNFGNRFISDRYIKPKFTVYQNAGYGVLSKPENHRIEFSKMDKVFLESGLVISDIFRVEYQYYYLGVGAGFFYRYGEFQLPSDKENLAIKFAASISFR